VLWNPGTVQVSLAHLEISDWQPCLNYYAKFYLFRAIRMDIENISS
jgi:hypothetical protein